MSASNTTSDKEESPSDASVQEQIARERFLRFHIEEIGDRLLGLSHKVRDGELTGEEVRERLQEARAELTVTEELVTDE